MYIYVNYYLQRIQYVDLDLESTTAHWACRGHLHSLCAVGYMHGYDTAVCVHTHV